MSRTKRKGYYFLIDWADIDTSRDKKKWYKPDKKYKRMKSRVRKAKIKDALTKQKELPIQKKRDVWDWD